MQTALFCFLVQFDKQASADLGGTAKLDMIAEDEGNRLRMESILARDHKLRLHSESDALEVISSGLPACTFFADDLHPDFFNLSNQLAGNILQKFVNYHFPIAIIVPENHTYGLRVTELIRDHRGHPYIRFFTIVEDASEWLVHAS
jgi:hypothetical protein